MQTYARFRLILFVLLALSLGTLGFAHKSHAVSYTPDLVSYLASGGSLDDICLTDGGAAANAHCEACRLADSLTAPASSLAFLPHPACGERTAFSAAFAPPASPNHFKPARAPPEQT